MMRADLFMNILDASLFDILVQQHYLCIDTQMNLRNIVFSNSKYLSQLDITANMTK